MLFKLKMTVWEERGEAGALVPRPWRCSGAPAAETSPAAPQKAQEKVAARPSSPTATRCPENREHVYPSTGAREPFARVKRRMQPEHPSADRWTSPVWRGHREG